MEKHVNMMIWSGGNTILYHHNRSHEPGYTPLLNDNHFLIFRVTFTQFVVQAYHGYFSQAHCTCFLDPPSCEKNTKSARDGNARACMIRVSPDCYHSCWWAIRSHNAQDIWRVTSFSHSSPIRLLQKFKTIREENMDPYMQWTIWVGL